MCTQGLFCRESKCFFIVKVRLRYKPPSLLSGLAKFPSLHSKICTQMPANTGRILGRHYMTSMCSPLNIYEINPGAAAHSVRSAVVIFLVLPQI